MRNVFVILMIVIMTMPSFATTMCAVSDSVTVILDPGPGGSSYTQNASTGKWSTTFSYGTIYGISACLNSNQGKSQGGWVAGLTDVTNNGVTKTVVGNERYGQYCWCKMTHPMASRWVFFLDSGSASNCAGLCAYYCGYNVQSYSSLRVGLFGSVSQ